MSKEINRKNKDYNNILLQLEEIQSKCILLESNNNVSCIKNYNL
jgi:hypothetical protein